jgi:hypothetical protein
MWLLRASSCKVFAAWLEQTGLGGSAVVVHSLNADVICLILAWSSTIFWINSTFSNFGTENAGAATEAAGLGNTAGAFVGEDTITAWAAATTAFVGGWRSSRGRLEWSQQSTPENGYVPVLIELFVIYFMKSIFEILVLVDLNNPYESAATFNNQDT